MKTITLCGHHFWIAATLLFTTTFAGTCPADSIAVDEKTTWGNSPCLTAPKPDSKGRAGHWWWPKPSGRWGSWTSKKGNGGRIFAPWTRAEETDSAEPAPPYPEQPPPREPEWHLRLDLVLFPTDSAALSTPAEALLKRTATDLLRWLAQYPRDTIVCVGHTDDIGGGSYNMDLGLRRAKAVADYLITQGIDAASLQVESEGESDPQVPNDTIWNRALNRRVAYRIVLPPEERRFQPPMR